MTSDDLEQGQILTEFRANVLNVLFNIMFLALI